MITQFSAVLGLMMATSLSYGAGEKYLPMKVGEKTVEMYTLTTEPELAQPTVSAHVRNEFGVHCAAPMNWGDQEPGTLYTLKSVGNGCTEIRVNPLTYAAEVHEDRAHKLCIGQSFRINGQALKIIDVTSLCFADQDRKGRWIEEKVYKKLLRGAMLVKLEDDKGQKYLTTEFDLYPLSLATLKHKAEANGRCKGSGLWIGRTDRGEACSEAKARAEVIKKCTDMGFVAHPQSIQNLQGPKVCYGAPGDEDYCTFVSMSCTPK